MIQLYNHQKEGIEFLSTRKSAALIMEQGLGKTITMLAHLENLYIDGHITSALIVAPLSAMGAWTRDIHHFPQLVGVVTIINYDKVWRRPEYNRVWDCIILDEAHAIKSVTSKRTQFFIGKGKTMGLNSRSKYRYILTGTPLGNSKLEGWYSLMSFLQPDIYGTYNAFRERYCKLFQLPNSYVKIVTGFKNVDEMEKINAPYIFRRKKIDCLDLPNKNSDEIVLVPLKEGKVLKEVLKGFSTDMDMVFDNQLVVLTKARQLLSGKMMDDVGNYHEFKCDKIKYLKEILDYDDGKKVIFAHFKSSIQEIEKALKGAKYKFVTLDGNQKDKNIWKKFQSDDTIQVIIVQYASGCAGIDLFKANTTIYFEPTLSFTQLEQSRDRTHRIGQENACSYYHLITENTLEQAIYDKISTGTDFISSHLEKIVTQIK